MYVINLSEGPHTQTYHTRLREFIWIYEEPP